jgi:glycosyltransferase involved in cell wall biosynthesis
MTKVSIITVAYNAEATIEDTLKSVAAQSWPDVEHIVVDGASKDATLAIAQRHMREGGILISEPDDGLYDAMNKGIEHASGDIIGLLNADDFYPALDVLTQVVQCFNAHQVDAVFGDVGYVRIKDLTNIFRRYDSSRFCPSKIGWGWMPAHPSMFLTRAAYEKVGLYRTDYRIAADFEFVARAFGGHKLSYSYIPRILVHMRTGGVSSGLKASLTVSREALRACRENGIATSALMINSRYPAKVWEYFGS